MYRLDMLLYDGYVTIVELMCAICYNYELRKWEYDEDTFG